MSLHAIDESIFIVLISSTLAVLEHSIITIYLLHCVAVVVYNCRSLFLFLLFLCVVLVCVCYCFTKLCFMFTIVGGVFLFAVVIIAIIVPGKLSHNYIQVMDFVLVNVPFINYCSLLLLLLEKA